MNLIAIQYYKNFLHIFLLETGLETQSGKRRRGEGPIFETLHLILFSDESNEEDPATDLNCQGRQEYYDRCLSFEVTANVL